MHWAVKEFWTLEYIAGQAFHQRCVAELIVSACETSQARG